MWSGGRFGLSHVYPRPTVSVEVGGGGGSSGCSASSAGGAGVGAAVSVGCGAGVGAAVSVAGAGAGSGVSGRGCADGAGCTGGTAARGTGCDDDRGIGADIGGTAVMGAVIGCPAGIELASDPGCCAGVPAGTAFGFSAKAVVVSAFVPVIGGSVSPGP